ncbi:hypothetical protein M2322_004479 [Rhodoblastus acidophilus]|uniref:hypothetical protein n=1 Tax=Rhodoblastus acidophilus TaxID=1074 RepID=UPI0022250A28|nr:hypothetical protein [Rhodoblastus acidophilus]MCW2318910.1 hypothetical protein [Rhodoblastus acidophilus]
MLIWLPELTQAAVIALVRTCHARLDHCGVRRFADRGAPPNLSAALPIEAREAMAAIAALRSRIPEVEARLGSSSPKALALALARLDGKVYADRARRLHGVRLMPLGHP